jgi:CheY-like chemotaxis protein
MSIVLLIDYQPEIRFLNKCLLQELECEISESHDTTTALAALKEHNPFDVIFTALRMPEMNGIEFLDAVKAIYPKIPVVITSLAPHPILQPIAEKKADAYLFGYSTKARLREVLEKALGKK